MELNDLNLNYKVKYIDESEDRWRIYLSEGLKGSLLERYDQMISNSDYQLFIAALKLEYGYRTTKNVEEAFILYKESSLANSQNYLSMARLYDIYRTKEKKFVSNIKKDKNLELIYLFKSFAYLPLSILRGKVSNQKFPLDLPYIIASFMDANKLSDPKKVLSYIDSLKKSKKYNDILSQNDCNLIKGFIEGFYEYQYEEKKENSLNLLVALSLEENLEGISKLIFLYMEKLDNTDEDDKKQIEILKTKIYDLFIILEEKKYYKVYDQYGLFLYNEMRMFDKALQIFEEGYKHHMYECAIYYFHAFTKSDNQIIYEKNFFNTTKFIDIIQCLIDAFIYGKIKVLFDLFDYLYIMKKKYNLYPQITAKYMKYLNEIALLTKSFVDDDNGEENIKKFTRNEIDKVKYGANHALSMIYLYGLTTEVKLHLIKAKYFLKKTREFNEYSQPYYTRLIYKIEKKLFNLGIFEDKRELDKYETLVFKLYRKYKDYKYFGNTYYYYFGKLYEKGIGTEKNKDLARLYYQKGCKSLHSLKDSFIIVYKRYLSLKIINSNRLGNPYRVGNKTYNLNFILSAGNIKIKLQINENMSSYDIKNELYKRRELQNLTISILLYKGNALLDNDKLEKYNVKNDDTITVMVEKPNINFF